VPLPWSLFTAVASLPESDNDLWYGVAVWPSFWQSYMDIVIVDFEVLESSNYIQVVDIIPVSPDERDDILKCSQHPNRGVSLTEIHLLRSLSD